MTHPAPETNTTNQTNPTNPNSHTLTIELSFNNHGELVVTLPPQPNTSGGSITIARGYVEETLRNILAVDEKIARSAAKFFGEPTTKQLARDIKRANTDPIRPQNSPRTTAIDLEF